MVSSYKVTISEEAQKDIECIYEYIHNTLLAKSSAKRISQKIAKEILSLSQFAYKGTATEFVTANNLTYRKLIIENYIAYYFVKEETRDVFIVRAFDGRTNYHI